MKALALALLIVAGSVSAKPIAQVTSSAGSVVLDDAQHYCPAGTKQATYIGPTVVPGCWFVSHGFVWLFFADGDGVAIPEKAFKWDRA